MPRRYDRYAIVATLVLAGCDLVFPPGSGPAQDGPRPLDGRADGSPNVDTDLDGVFDDTDNCVNDPNGNQANGDGDANGDACDNCVLVTNEDQLDDEADGIGDACDLCPGMAGAEYEEEDVPDGIGSPCDPYPCDPSDDWVAFEGFAQPPTWPADPIGVWSSHDGIVHVADAGGGATRMITPYDLDLGGVMASIKLDVIDSFAVGIQVLSVNAPPWNGVRCLVADDGLGHQDLRIEDNSGAIDGQPIGAALETPIYMMVTLVPGASGGVDLHCQIRSANGSIQTSATAGMVDTIPLLGTRLGLYGRDVAATFYWVDISTHSAFAPLTCVAKPTR